jgi:ABC-type uncharacterized transport system ATPase subunit
MIGGRRQSMPWLSGGTGRPAVGVTCLNGWIISTHAMARLTSVGIRRFKRIEDLTVDLGDVTLLIGANNSGKSSILQAIHFGISIAQTARLVGEGVAWRNDKFELSYNPSQLL